MALVEKKKAEEAKLQALEQARIARENAHRAETEKRAAEAARSATEAQRQLAVKETERAEAKTKENARLLYAANINLAQQAYDDKEVSRAQELIACSLGRKKIYWASSGTTSGGAIMTISLRSKGTRSTVSLRCRLSGWQNARDRQLG